MLPRPWAAAAAAPARAGAGRMLEFWECLTPPPPAQTPCPRRGLPRRARPARCGLAGAPTSPGRRTLRGTRLLFLFFWTGGGGGGPVLGSGCLRGLGCKGSEIPGRNLRGEGACFSKNLPAASPVTPYPFDSPRCLADPPRTASPRPTARDPPTPPGSARSSG